MPVTSPYTDIQTIIERHASIRIVSKAYVHGVLELHSNCPWCPGSSDSFIIRPSEGTWGHHIRAKGCRKSGDMLDFLTGYVGMSKYEACEEIGLDPADLWFIMDEKATERTLAREKPPGKVWQEQARALLHVLAQMDTLQKHREVLSYLHNRGLTDATIEQFGLQYIPMGKEGWFAEDDPKKWGLSEMQEAKLLLPEGILIPWHGNGHIWKLSIRRLTNIRKGVKYMEIEADGQGVTLFNSDAFKPDMSVVLCESEIDAISGTQACTLEGVCFLATGGVGKAQYPHIVQMLKQAKCVLVAFDDDAEIDGKRAGDEGTKFWLTSLPNAIRHTPWAHDVNDMLVAGQYIQAWVQVGLDTYALMQDGKDIPTPEIEQIDADDYPAYLLYRADQLEASIFLDEHGQLKGRGHIPADLKAQISAYKSELIALLSPECTECLALPEYQSCEAHRLPFSPPLAREEQADIQPAKILPLARAITGDKPPVACKKCRKSTFLKNREATGWICWGCENVYYFPFTHVLEPPYLTAQTPEQFWANIERKNNAFDPTKQPDWAQYGFTRKQK